MAKCKSCNGNNAKKLSVVEKMGTETGTASTTGIGVSGGGVGVGFGKTSINKKSNLAREASFSASDEAMKSDSSTNIGCALLFFSEMGFIFYAVANDYSTFFWIVGMLVIAFLCFLLMAFIPQSGGLSKYDLEKNEWERTWMCLDCGHKWVEKSASNMFASPRVATNKKRPKKKANKKYSELKKEINKKEKEISKKTKQLGFTKDKKLKETIKKELEVLEKENDKLLPKKAEIQKYDELEKAIDRITGKISFTKNKKLKETFKKELEVLEEEINKLFS